MLRVFDTMARREEAFAPIRGKTVLMYACGPSVYQRAHIGNHRTYVFEDTFKRYLRYRGYSVRHVTNLTDVENKAVQEANRQGRSLREITGLHARQFFADMKKLNVAPADAYPRATKTIPEIVRLVLRLKRKGLAYEHGGDWWFDVSKFPRYGRLSRLKSRIPAGRRIRSDDYYKWQAGDFVLWRAWRPADGEVYWDTALGRGRPGGASSARPWRSSTLASPST